MHAWLIAGIILMPVLPLGAEYRMRKEWDSGSSAWKYFSYNDANNNGVKDSGESQTEVQALDDPDMDGLTNEEEFVCGTSPYNIDSDYDGITDGDEVNTLGGAAGGYDPNLWDTDGDGYSDHDEFYNCTSVNYLTDGMGSSYYDWDGDGWKNPDDSHPFDSILFSDWDGDGYNYGSEPTGPMDSDGDGHEDGSDSHPYDSAYWNDWNYNGTPDDQESGGGSDSDADGYDDPSDSHPYDNSRWNDWNDNGYDDYWEGEDADGDGFLNLGDSHPYDSSLWSDWDYNGYNSGDGSTQDSDGDGYADDVDTHPYDSGLWSDGNNNGVNDEWESIDSDADGYPDFIDSHPSDPDLWTDANDNGINDDADSDGDGYLDDGEDTHPYNALLWDDKNNNYQNDCHESANDSDGDGYNNPPGAPIGTNDPPTSYNPEDYDSDPNDARYYTDWDGDRLNAHEEVAIGTDPRKSDTDDDNLSDWHEVLQGTNPLDPDSDDDGLTDFEELHLTPPSNPLDKHSRSKAMGMGTAMTDWELSEMAQDTDGDGIPDPVERIYGLNPNDPADAEGDLDADEITNLAEYNAGTSLWGNNDVYDSDGDGITDLVEDMTGLFYPDVLHKYRSSDATEDADGDGLLNYEEIALGLDLMDADSSTPEVDEYSGSGVSADMLYAQTHGHAGWQMPVQPGDTDGDQMPDVWEHYYRVKGGLPGLDLRDGSDWSEDPDEDLLSNRSEVLAYRNPLVADYNEVPVTPGNYDPGAGVTSPYVPQLPPAQIMGTAKNYKLTDVVTPSEGEAAGSGPIFEGKETQNGNAGTWEEGKTRAVARAKSVPSPHVCYPTGDPPTDLGQTCQCMAHETPGRFKSAKSSSGGGQVKVWLQGENTPDEDDDIYYFTDGGGDDYYYWTLDETVQCAIDGEPSGTGESYWGSAAVRMYLSEPNVSGNPTEYLVRITHHNFGQNEPIVSYETLYIGSDTGFSNEVRAYASALPGGESTVEVEVVLDSAQPGSYHISASDSAGPKYRKVGLNGIPMPDSKPQVQDESGELPEETYIDAFNAQLRHSVSDVYVQDDSTLLPLQVRRDLSPAIWNDRNGMLPHEKPFLPFGPGWSSNICSYVHFTVNSSGCTAEVVDEMGASQTYTYSSARPFWLHNRQELTDVKSFQNTFTAYPLAGGLSFSGIRLNKKFGTRCFYEMVPAAQLFQELSSDRYYGSESIDSHFYARLARVEDRWGNQLVYEYPAGSLIPHTIRDPNRPGHQIFVEQVDGRVTTVRSPNGDVISYGYQPVSFVD